MAAAKAAALGALCPAAARGRLANVCQGLGYISSIVDEGRCLWQRSRLQRKLL